MRFNKLVPLNLAKLSMQVESLRAIRNLKVHFKNSNLSPTPGLSL
jgi:hypothetical protein